MLLRRTGLLPALAGTLSLTACGGGTHASDTGTVTDAGPDIVDVSMNDVVDAGPMAPLGTVAISQWHGDLQRTGSNTHETILTQAAVMSGNFHLDPAFAPTFDDQIYAQPLYLPALPIAGGMHDVLFVVTLANSVYAVDAFTGAQLWMQNLGTPTNHADQPCGNIDPYTGILGTPAIDPATNTLYVVSYSNPGPATFSINALDATTGMQRAGYPAAIVPPMSNGSRWDAITQQERGGITFAEGRIYVPFGGLWGDCGTYHGWVVGIDPANPSNQTAFATSGNESGLWAPGGIAADGAGHLFVATGNGETLQSMGNYTMRLATGASGPTFSNTSMDYFVPSNSANLNANDVDVGTVSPVVLPDHTGSSTPHLLLQGSKSGVVFLVDRDNLGGMGTGNGVTGEAVYSNQVFGQGCWAGAAAWSNGTDVYGFMVGHGRQPSPCSHSGGVAALHLTLQNGQSAFETTFCTASASDAAAPFVSSNGASDPILWMVDVGTRMLRAYAIPSGMEIYTSTGADQPPSTQHLTAPIVANGRVYVTGADGVHLYRMM